MNHFCPIFASKKPMGTSQFQLPTVPTYPPAASGSSKASPCACSGQLSASSKGGVMGSSAACGMVGLGEQNQKFNPKKWGFHGSSTRKQRLFRRGFLIIVVDQEWAIIYGNLQWSCCFTRHWPVQLTGFGLNFAHKTTKQHDQDPSIHTSHSPEMVPHPCAGVMTINRTPGKSNESGQMPTFTLKNHIKVPKYDRVW